MFTDVVDLIKSYGPSTAGWVILLVFVAFILGKGGKLAMGNVKSLLDAGEDLRKRQKLALDDCEAQIARRDEKLKEYERDMETARRTMRRMRDEMNDLEEQVIELTRQIRKLTTGENR